MSTESPVSPIRVSRPELRVEAAAINDEPVELDGTPSSAAIAQTIPAHSQDGSSLTAEDKKKMAQLIAERQEDPAVMVDLPQTPQAEELAAAEVAAGIGS
ncbi:hypothetical protein ANO11243_001110 [Dothideomycetidae sp. 11243]|nr:hypothetical protein ANO11243_001110 [fungal sp. No.11243]